MHERDGRDSPLSTALRAVAEDDARRGASADVEARLRSHVRGLARARRRTLVVRLAYAAVLLVAVAVPGWRLAGEWWLTTAPTTNAVAADNEVSTEFLPLLYSAVPAVQAQLVRIEVPRAALASFGLGPVDAVNGASADTVLADVLVGEDGLARAVRFVRAAQRPRADDSRSETR